MKILIIIVAVIAILIGIVAIIPAFLDEEAKLQRSAEINKSAADIYNVVSDYNRMTAWNPWMEIDPDVVTKITGNAGEVGSTYEWESQNEQLGSGMMTIEEVVPNKSMKEKLEFKAPFQMVASSGWILEEIDSTTTKVTWHYGGSYSYFMRYWTLGLESMLGPQYERGLTNLKNLVENMPASKEEMAEEPEMEAVEN
ncbi:MAG: hypothetical protein D8M58_09190 [Calditrichaeota bacterium]|nr:MAG: hypothetical protein DWQ03_17300 [Calditrichota bacterium]MBL1205560.1 hypothetical protein [Calditrichota bacterium]NOG45389.1 SRPBCC family protein [Calditrichota bacterium]